MDQPRSAQLDDQHSYLYLNILQEISDRFTRTNSHIERTLQEWSDSTAHKLLEALHKQQDGTHEHIRASAIQEAELKLAEMKLQNEQLHKTMVALQEKHVKELAGKPPYKKRKLEHILEQPQGNSSKQKEIPQILVAKMEPAMATNVLMSTTLIGTSDCKETSLKTFIGNLGKLTSFWRMESRYFKSEPQNREEGRFYYIGQLIHLTGTQREPPSMPEFRDSKWNFKI